MIEILQWLIIAALAAERLWRIEWRNVLSFAYWRGRLLVYR